MIETKVLMALALLIAVGVIAWSLIRRHKLPLSRIDLDDLLLGDDGKLSKAAAVMMGSFAATTWVIVYLALNDKLTEGFFAAYLAAWVAPTLAKVLSTKQIITESDKITVTTTKVEKSDSKS